MVNIFNIIKLKRPETKLFFGYLSYVIIGVVLLSIPFFRKVNVTFLDNLFTTVSAISTTGLATVSTFDSYSIFGQIVVILLIQIGGIGYMTFGSFIILSTRNVLSKNREEIHKTSFSLPSDFSINKFIKSIVIYTIIVEVIGAILLMFVFYKDGRANFIWSSIFHSISAFCTAGFSLYNNSFESYSSHYFLNIVIFILSFLGAIGYIVMVDFWLMLRGKKDKITFTSKIILTTTVILLLFGTTLILIERIIKSGNFDKDLLLTSFFQSMTALTTVGFNTIPIGTMSSSSLFVISILMIIGASPSGTGGGIKSTTISSMFGIIGSVFSSKKEYINFQYPNFKNNEENNVKTNKNKFFEIFSSKNTSSNEITDKSKELSSLFGDLFKIKLLNRIIPFDRIIHAVATFVFYFAILFVGILLLLSFENFTFEQIFFEAASALGTVGLSTGITGNLNIMGKIIIITLMFIGRLGPITFGVILFGRKEDKKNAENRVDDLVI
ncbi:MAG TPA: potassium transporter TrkG [Spirochaetota bacterium]|nr:potassium transporter TrkG [Spirochaetota bacterium]